MKRSPLTIAVGAVLLLVFVLLLFAFQVRQSEVAVVTTFGKPTRDITRPGLYFKWPWPIQQVHTLDRRIHTFESKFEETLTPDGFNLLVAIYVGWQITEPMQFFPKFGGGTVAEAEKALEALGRSVKNEVIGQHPFSDLISTNAQQLKFEAIEEEMLRRIQGQVQANQYGLGIRFVGIRRLGLPESVTKTVFERMESERQVLISRIQFQGEEEALKIRSDADREAARILADAEAQATRIRGEGEAQAARSFEIFKQDPELALFLLKLSGLESFLREKATLILDPNTPPLDLLRPAPVPGQK